MEELLHAPRERAAALKAWHAHKERCVPEHLAEPLLLRFAKEAQAAPLVRRFWRM